MPVFSISGHVPNITDQHALAYSEIDFHRKFHLGIRLTIATSVISVN